MQVSNVSNTPKDKKVKVYSTITTILGTVASMCVIRKSRGIKNIVPSNYKEADIFMLASGSVYGGYVGGSLADPYNRKAKFKEGIVQLFGNTLIPLLCVSGSIRAYRTLSKNIKEGVQVLIGALSLGIGILAGNKTCNLINNKLFHNKEKRNIRPTDFAPHIDDICMGTSLILNNSKIGEKVSRFIPLALFIGGYKTGIAKEDTLDK